MSAEMRYLVRSEFERVHFRVVSDDVLPYRYFSFRDSSGIYVSDAISDRFRKSVATHFSVRDVLSQKCVSIEQRVLECELYTVSLLDTSEYVSLRHAFFSDLVSFGVGDVSSHKKSVRYLSRLL